MAEKIVESAKIVLICIIAAIIYGIVHDQVTTRVCVEYFTIGHPPVFHTESPTLLAIGWGIIATWWVGFLLGLPAAGLMQFGRRPPLPTRRIVKPIGLLLAVMGFLALVVGLITYFAAQRGDIWLEEPMASLIPAEKHAVFLADLLAHLTSYFVGFFGGILVWVWLWRARKKAARELSAPES